MHSVIDHRYM